MTGHRGFFYHFIDMENGLRFRGASDAAARSALVMIPHDDPVGAVRRLAERDIIVDSRPGYVRVSPHFYNTHDEVDRFVDVLAGGDG